MDSPPARPCPRAPRLAWRVLGVLVLLLVSAGCLTRLPGAQLPEGEAPDFTLRDFEGHRVNLRESLADGPTVVVFYRGHW